MRYTEPKYEKINHSKTRNKMLSRNVQLPSSEKDKFTTDMRSNKQRHSSLNLNTSSDEFEDSEKKL